MIKVGIDISELLEIKKRIEKINASKSFEIQDKILLEQAGIFIKEVSKRTPVKTGNLRSHWIEDNKNLQPKTRRGKRSVQITNKAEYARNIELGEIKSRNIKFTPRHMMKNTEIYMRKNNFESDTLGMEYTNLLGKDKFDYERNSN